LLDLNLFLSIHAFWQSLYSTVSDVGWSVWTWLFFKKMMMMMDRFWGQVETMILHYYSIYMYIV